MLWGALGLLVVAVGLSGAEVAYRWDKGMILPQMGERNWRATSFAIAEEKMFLTLIDTKKEESGNGVVGTFNMTSSSPSPPVSIFPHNDFYKLSHPLRGRATTPFTTRTDDCRRLWLLDSAVQNISGHQLKTNPAIFVFDTNTTNLTRAFHIPLAHWTSASFFANFVLGTRRHDCRQTIAYLADYNRFRLLAYDFFRNTSHLKTHPFFSPDPLVHTPEEVLLNPSHQDVNGVLGLALAEEEDALYFHPLAGTHEFRVGTRRLLSEGDLRYGDVEVFKDKGEHSEAGASVFDRETEAIFFGEVSTRKIGVLGLRNSSGYFRYDFQLGSGYVADLIVRGGALWVLVDDKAEVVIHKLSIADVTEELRRQVPAGPSSGTRVVVLHPVVLLPFLLLFGFL